MRRALPALILAGLLGACSAGHVSFPVTEAGQKALPDSVTVVRLDAAAVAALPGPPHRAGGSDLPASGNWNYKVGVGDILSIDVFDHPELTLPAGPQRSAAESGFRVQADGTFFYPFVGQVTAKGRAPEEIREDLRTRLATYIPNPQLEVRVAAFNSQAVVVTGEVATPSRQALTTVPVTLLDAVNAAGGLTEAADAGQIRLQRGQTSHVIDLQGFLDGQALRNNPLLQNGDIVSVPRKITQEAYLLGQVSRPAAIDLTQDPVTLTQAITRQGGLDERRADARGVFVFRKTGAGVTVYQLDVASPAGLLVGTGFYLQPDDVVYVTRSPSSAWNDTISQVLPTLAVAREANDAGL